LFFKAEDLPSLREKARNSDRELWQAVLRNIKTLKQNAPDPRDEDLYKSGLDKRKEGSISQYAFAFQIAQTGFAYAIEQDEKYLDAAKKWTLAACEMPLWGYTYNKPNVDLPPAHLLYAVAFAYDILHDKLTASEKEIIRNKLVKQARLMYDYFKYKPKKRYSYSQNHTSIPMAGLAITAYVLMDETEEAKDWAQLARAVFDRTLTTFATDGYFYEGFHYFTFSFRWTIRYLDAHKQATGEDLYPQMREKFAPLKLYAMHSILPDRENVFDFADTGDGSPNRINESKREKLYGEYDILYRLASVYQDSQAQAVGDFIRTETTFDTREPMWAFLQRDPNFETRAACKHSDNRLFQRQRHGFLAFGLDAQCDGFRVSRVSARRSSRRADVRENFRLAAKHRTRAPGRELFYYLGERQIFDGRHGLYGTKTNRRPQHDFGEQSRAGKRRTARSFQGSSE